jgi:hypothetical protein
MHLATLVMERRKTLAKIKRRKIVPKRIVDQAATEAAAKSSLMEPTGEKVRTSLFLDHTILADAKRRARVMGISFNAYATVALYNQSYWMDRQNGHGIVESGVSLPTPALIPRDGRSGDAPTKKDPLAKFGKGFELQADSPDDDPAFATWDQVEQYAGAVRGYLDKNKQPPDWMRLGRQLGLDMGAARAADVAMGTDTFEQYMETKYGK